MTPTDDECFVSIDVYHDHDTFKAMIDYKFETEEIEEDWLEVMDYKAPYCQIEERLHDIAKKGLIFRGGHGTNGSYPEGLFCAINGNLYIVDSIDDEPVVQVLPSGIVAQGALHDAKEYWRAMKKIDDITRG